jgi:surfeit locus 1 family protein
MRRLWPTVITVLLLTVLVGLGTWQVKRLEWKEGLIAAMDHRMREEPIEVAALPEAEDETYRAAVARGTFLHEQSFYQLAISLGGEGGYHVLTPLRLEDGRFLLVDRGWVPYGRRQDYDRPMGLVSLAGILRRPEHHWSQPVNDPVKNYWYVPDLSAMAKVAGVPAFLPYVLEVDARPNPGGYPIGGQTRIELPNNHLGYALTWYGLALALLVIYSLSVWRKGSADYKAAGSAAGSLRPDGSRR